MTLVMEALKEDVDPSVKVSFSVQIHLLLGVFEYSSIFKSDLTLDFKAF